MESLAVGKATTHTAAKVNSIAHLTRKCIFGEGRRIQATRFKWYKLPFLDLRKLVSQSDFDLTSLELISYGTVDLPLELDYMYRCTVRTVG